MSPAARRPMRIARLITWLPVGGIERRLVAVLPRLKERGHDVKLFCLRERGVLADELERAGVPVELVALKSRLDPAGLAALARALRAFAPDVVHCHMYRSSVPGTIAARRAGVPVILGQVHNVGTWEDWRQRAMDRLLCRWRTGMIGVSEAVCRDVRENLRLPASRVHLLYNGCDTQAFRPDDALRARTRAELALDDNDVVALVPARLHAQKAPLATLRAFARALDEGATRGVLLLAGDGPLAGELDNAIRALGLERRARLLGRRDDMAALYNAADVVVLSTLKEGFSNAVVEALACGRPVIAADVGGNREAIDGDATGSDAVGWIHAAGDVDALALQLHAALSDRGGLDLRREACRARGLRFSLDRLVLETEDLYTRLLEAARP